MHPNSQVVPLVKKSTYKARGAFRNHHFNTMFAGLVRAPSMPSYTRHRIDTPDGDFLDIDCLLGGRPRALILLHGLEGHSKRPYMTGMANCADQHGFDVIAMNFRGCSGEPNRLPATYHIGQTIDLETVIAYALAQFHHTDLAIIGFSVGGNVTLKYLGERGYNVPDEVKAAVAFSAPVDVVSSNTEIDKWYNWHYRKNLVDALNAKYRQKAEMFPEMFDKPSGGWPKSFREFDNLYTAPVNGYQDATEYWSKNSSIHFIPKISTPTLLVNALDDTFLSPECYPYQLAENHPYFHLETPEKGGHLGFAGRNTDGIYWSEKRAIEFITGYV